MLLFVSWCSLLGCRLQCSDFLLLVFIDFMWQWGLAESCQNTAICILRDYILRQTIKLSPWPATISFTVYFTFFIWINLERTTCCSKDIWLHLMTWLLNQLIMESMPFGFNLFKSKTLLPDCTCLSHLNKIWRFQHKFPLSNVLFHLLLSIYC